MSGPRVVFSAEGYESYPVAGSRGFPTRGGESAEDENAVVDSRRLLPLGRSARRGPPAVVAAHAVERRTAGDATALRAVSARLDAAANAIDAVEVGVRSASDSLDSLLHLLDSRPAAASIAGRSRGDAARASAPSTATTLASTVGGLTPAAASVSASTNNMWPMMHPSLISGSAAMVAGEPLPGTNIASATSSSGGSTRQLTGEAPRDALLIRGVPSGKPEESRGSSGLGRGEIRGLSQAEANLQQTRAQSTLSVDPLAEAEQAVNADAAGVTVVDLSRQQAPLTQIDNVAGSAPVVPATEELGLLSPRDGRSRRTNPSNFVAPRLEERARVAPQAAARDVLSVDQTSTAGTRLESASGDGGGDPPVVPREILPVLGSGSSREPSIACLRRTGDSPQSLSFLSADIRRSIDIGAIASDPSPQRTAGARRSARGMEPAVAGAAVVEDGQEESHRDIPPRNGSVDTSLPALELEAAMDGIDAERGRLMLEIARLRSQQNESLTHLVRLQQEQFLVRQRQVTTLSDIINSFGRTVEAAGALPHGEDSSLGRISGDVVSTLRRMLHLLSATVPVAVATVSSSTADVSVVATPPAGDHPSPPLHPSQDDRTTDPPSPLSSSALVGVRSAGAGDNRPGPYAVGGRVALRPAGDLTQEVINAALQALPRLAAAATALSGARRLQGQGGGGAGGDDIGAGAGVRDADSRCSPETIAALPDAPPSRKDGSGSGGGGTGAVRGCVICLSEGDTESQLLCHLPCDHVFHRVCVGKWLRVQASCPTCRRQVPNVEVGPVVPEVV